MYDHSLPCLLLVGCFLLRNLLGMTLARIYLGLAATLVVLYCLVGFIQQYFFQS